MHLLHNVDGNGHNISCDIDSKGIMYFLISASPSEPLDVAISNFAGEIVASWRGYLTIFRMTLTKDKFAMVNLFRGSFLFLCLSYRNIQLSFNFGFGQFADSSPNAA